jgi:hypothetical protein
MELYLMQLIFTSIVFAASIVPLYFAVNLRSESQRIVSLFLFIALLAYGIHSLLESFGVINYDIFVKLCFIISACGLIIAYSILQLKSSHVLIGGMFGIAMIISFGVWMVGELLEATFFATEEQHEIMDQISSGVMAGFSIFIIVRFLWLRRIVYVESRT